MSMFVSVADRFQTAGLSDGDIEWFDIFVPKPGL
jgi:hypothetical protein